MHCRRFRLSVADALRAAAPTRGRLGDSPRTVCCTAFEGSRGLTWNAVIGSARESLKPRRITMTASTTRLQALRAGFGYTRMTTSQ